MELRFDGRAVMVTGASTGIGAALARGFGAAGAAVGIHYHRSEEEARRVAKDVESSGGDVTVLQADLSVPGGADRLIGAAVDGLGRLDVLVNNAGALVERTEIAEATDDVYREIMDLNVRSVFEACRAAVPVMRRQGSGAIVNVSSISARTGGGGGSVLYAAAKAAVATFTRGLAAELATEGIRVNALSPGLIETPFQEKFTPPELFERIVGTIPLGRAGRAEECVGPTLFLAADDAASYVTGQVLEVNGGQYSP